jgi:hypothetical protein
VGDVVRPAVQAVLPPSVFYSIQTSQIHAHVTGRASPGFSKNFVLFAVAAERAGAALKAASSFLDALLLYPKRTGKAKIMPHGTLGATRVDGVLYNDQRTTDEMDKRDKDPGQIFHSFHLWFSRALRFSRAGHKEVRQSGLM